MTGMRVGALFEWWSKETIGDGVIKMSRRYRHIDLTGQKFNKLTVIKRVDGKDKRRATWLCQCECGNYKEVLAQQLKSGMCKSCGCLLKESAKARTLDLTGRKIGRLTVIEQTENRRGVVHWLCECECGNRKVIASWSLSKNITTSCGCKKIVHGDLTGRKFGRLLVIESPRKVDYRKRRVWKCLCDCGTELEVVTDALVSKGTKSCGCLQTDVNKARMELIKEIRNENILVYDTTIAGITPNPNRKVHSNTGVLGVTFTQGKYNARISFQKKAYHLGSFNTLEEAAKARKEAEQKMHVAFLDWYYENHPEKKRPLPKTENEQVEK
ncbi:MAG: hypothetical protein FWC32_05275 [Firmicutes bacterium]|nr:hypothetical protein [Bacillota bacterium]